MKKLFVGIIVLDVLLLLALIIYFFPALGAIVGIFIGSLLLT